MNESLSINTSRGNHIKLTIYSQPIEKDEQDLLIGILNQNHNPQDICQRLFTYQQENKNYYLTGYINENQTFHILLTMSLENPHISSITHLLLNKGTKIEQKKLFFADLPDILKTINDYMTSLGTQIILFTTSNPDIYKKAIEAGYKPLLGDTKDTGSALLFYESAESTLQSLFQEEKQAYWIERGNLSLGDLPLLQLLYSSINRDLLSPDEPILLKNYPQAILTGVETPFIFYKLFETDYRNSPIYINKVERGNNLIRSIVTVKKRYLPIELIVDFDFYFLEGFENGFYTLAEEVIQELSNFPGLSLEYKGFNKKKIEILKSLGFKNIEKRDEEYFLFKGEKLKVEILRKKLP